MEERIPAVSAGGVGTVLRRARERRGAKLEDVARDTCISVAYLSALERGAPLAAFPAPVYARGFLRTYARYLRLDARPLLERCWQGEEVPDPVTQAMLATNGPTERPRRLTPTFRVRTR